MLGLIIQLLISWLLLWVYNKSNLKELGLTPTKQRLIDFGLFFTITAALCASGFLLKMLIAQQRWQINDGYNGWQFANAFWWNIKSVLFEEFIFRGVLLYILIKRIGQTKAILISAISFGVYHWFSHEIFGQIQAMIIEFITTGVIGLVLAFGFSKTSSMYIPIAIHLGWNYMQQAVFSGGPIGNQIFIEIMPRPVITVSYFAFFFMILFPLVSTIGVNYWMIRRKKEVI